MIIRIKYTGLTGNGNIIEMKSTPGIHGLPYDYVIIVDGEKATVMKTWAKNNNITLIQKVSDWGKDPVLFNVDDEELALMILNYC